MSEKGYVATKETQRKPKHMIYVGAAWTIVWEGQKAEEAGNHAIKHQIC